MKKLITVVMSLVIIGSAPFAMARDANRDYQMHILKQQEESQKRWEAVQKAPTPAGRDEALSNYFDNLPSRWAPPPT